mmetsp:Transcript_10722/g.26271  ORF Transcript_10722/g.26271 Transcript_10722/m.26271 type:complete len:204 (-) Transcript_10722:655-1266(-)
MNTLPQKPVPNTVPFSKKYSSSSLMFGSCARDITLAGFLVMPFILFPPPPRPEFRDSVDPTESRAVPAPAPLPGPPPRPLPGTTSPSPRSLLDLRRSAVESRIASPTPTDSPLPLGESLAGLESCELGVCRCELPELRRAPPPPPLLVEPAPPSGAPELPCMPTCCLPLAAGGQQHAIQHNSDLRREEPEAVRRRTKRRWTRS